jgi:hypothetical protein
MTTGIQVVFDCADPNGLATFWAAALGYRLQDPPEGFASWQDWLRDQGIPEDRWNDASAIVDPDGGRPRIYFQRVPEAKTVKNRVHLDLGVSGGPSGGSLENAAGRSTRSRAAPRSRGDPAAGGRGARRVLDGDAGP